MFKFWSSVRESTPEAALAAVRGGALLIDVRSPGEFRSGRAAGARSLPLPSLDERSGGLPREGEIHLICASGSRSRIAARKLVRRASPTSAASGAGRPAGPSLGSHWSEAENAHLRIQV